MPCEEAERRLEVLAREVGIEAVQADELLAIREAPASADELAIPSQVEDAAGRQALDAAGAGAGDAAQPPRVQPSTSPRRSLVEERLSTAILLLSVGGGALALLNLRGVAAHGPLLSLRPRVCLHQVRAEGARSLQGLLPHLQVADLLRRARRSRRQCAHVRFPPLRLDCHIRSRTLQSALCTLCVHSLHHGSTHQYAADYERGTRCALHTAHTQSRVASTVHRSLSLGIYHNSMFVSALRH